MRTPATLVPLDDPAEVLRRYRTVQAAVRLPGDATIRLVKRERWVAVPLEDSFKEPSVRYEDEPDELANVASLCARGSPEVLWALTLHDTGAFENLRHKRHQGSALSFADVAATEDGLRAVALDFRVYAHNYALCPPDVGWVVLSSTRSDWWAVMGEADVVEHVIGRTLAEGYRRFEEAAIECRDRGDEPLGVFHLELLATLRDDYPRLAPGQSVPVDAEWADWAPVPLPPQD